MCYAVRWQFRWQAETVASIIAQKVFSEIRRVARSDAPLPKRRAEAAKKITLFKADLAVARVQATTKSLISLSKSSRHIDPLSKLVTII